MTTTTRCCRACGREIPAARLAAVPDTPWCVRCAETRVEPLGGNMIWDHKTAPELEIKPLRVARAFAAQTERHAYNVSIEGVSTFDEESER